MNVEPQYDEAQALTAILTALEYGTRKEETDIINPLIEPYGLGGTPKPRLVRALLKQPGFENFFLEVLKAVRPFSLMLREIYEFLNTNEVTTKRRAAKFLIQSDKAKANLTFDLQNFPKELLKVLSETNISRSVITLRFDGINLTDAPVKWRTTQADKNWAALSPRWDGNFYDNGFYRALVYANTILEPYPALQEEANKIVEPILDRLAAISEFSRSVWSMSTARETDTFRGSSPQIEFVIQDLPGHSYVVRDPNAAAYLTHQVLRDYDNDPVSISELLFAEMRGFAIANTLWRRRDLRIAESEYDNWAMSHFGQPLSQVRPEGYLDLLRRLAGEYSLKLDKVAPVIDSDTSTVALESLVEFLNLPFWKNRWFVYELWTLIRVLNIAQRLAPVRLNNVEEVQDDVVEWKLPGGMAKQPVAFIGEEPKQILCWAQRKTYHPGTGAGLEPDFRLTKSDPGFHDIVIIENKDRLTIQTMQLSEILDRYAGGTCAESVWLINYEVFPASAFELEETWSPGRVRIASNFRPDVLPKDFEANIEQILRKHLEVPVVEVLDHDLLSVANLSEVVLSWKQTPRDLDLHAWIQDSSGTHHVYYGEKGCRDSTPYAELHEDQMGGNGEETLKLEGNGFKRLLIAVYNYSNETSLAACGAEIIFHFGVQRLILRVPLSGPGRWWHALLIDGSSIEVLQQLTEEDPSL